MEVILTGVGLPHPGSTYSEEASSRFFLGACSAAFVLWVVVSSELTTTLFVAVGASVVCVVGLISRWQSMWTVTAAYLLIPSPADNALPAIDIFPSNEGAAPIDVLVFGDLVLLAFLVRLLMTRRHVGASNVQLTVPLVILVTFGPLVAAVPFEYPWPAFFWGVALVVRASAMWILVRSEAREQSSGRMLMHLERSIVACSALLGLGAALVKLALWGRPNLVIQAEPDAFRLLFDGRVRLPGWGNNTLAAILVVGLSLCLFFGRRRLNWPGYLVAGCALLQLAGLLATQMRIPLLLVGAALVWRGVRWLRVAIPGERSAPKPRLVAVGFAAVLALGFAISIVNPRFQDVGTRSVDLYLGRAEWERPGDGTFVNRGEVARLALLVIAESPYLGHGWGSWGWVRSEVSQRVPEDTRPGMDPHSDYLLLLAESGALGVGVLLVLPLGALVLLSWQQRRRLRSASMSFAHVAVLAAVGLASVNFQNARFAAIYWAVIAAALTWLKTDDSLDDRGPDGKRREVILGARVDDLTAIEMTDRVEALVEDGGKHAIGNHNVNSVRLIQVDPEMLAFYRSAEVVHIDGMGVVLLGKLLGSSMRADHRTAYIDWMPRLLSLARQRRWRVFYLGGREGVARQAFEPWFVDAPELFDWHHGFFDSEPDGRPNQLVLERIRRFRPHLLFVGMGMPRQERWVLQAWRDLPPSVVLTCGGCADYFAGEQRMPPRWLGRIGLEWAYRLATNPRRLAKRYLWEPLALIPLILRELAIGPDHESIEPRTSESPRSGSRSGR